MNAVEFVREFAVFGAKEYLAGATFYKDKLMVFTDIDDLKQIVDAYELVESLGGMDMAKDIFDIEIHEPHYNYDAEKVTRIEQAINLVEKCQ